MKNTAVVNGIALTIICLTVACTSSSEEPPYAIPPEEETNAEPVPFQAFLFEWYAAYDADQNLTYLDRIGTLSTESINGITYEVRRNLPYGPHGERTSMDVYFPNNATSATPLVMFVHGGGFRAKDKMDVLGNRTSVLGAYLENKIAVASINYRFRSTGISETEVNPDWNCSGTLTDGHGCRLDIIYRDGARAVQYLRYRSELLNLDPTRFGAWGRSAGSQIATWVALVPDLAIADHPDPVLRQSSRLQVVGHTYSQATGASFLWPELVNFQQETEGCDQTQLWTRLTSEDETIGFNDALQASVEFLTEDPRGQELMRVVNFLEVFAANAPPLITTTPVRDYSCEALQVLSDEDLQGTMLHHPRHIEPLFARCLEKKNADECEIVSDVQDTFTDEIDAWKNDEEHVFSFIAGVLLETR